MSTLIERMAKNVAEARQHGCHYAEGTCDQCASIAANFIATLEGMAAPMDKPVIITRFLDGTFASGDSPSPQQPTQEALAFLEAESPGAFRGEEADWMGSILDRFAAQRVTAASSQEAIEVAKDIRQELMRMVFVNDGVDDRLTLPAGHLAVIAKHVTAATDKARREGWEQARQDCADIVRRCHGTARTAFSFIKNLPPPTPQSPGDAADADWTAPGPSPSEPPPNIGKHIAALEPPRADLASDEPDWRRYADGMCELIGRATEADLNATRFSELPHMQKLRAQSGDDYRRVMDAVRARSTALQERAA